MLVHDFERLISIFIFSTIAIDVSKNQLEIYSFSTLIKVIDFLFTAGLMTSKKLRMILSSIAQLRLFFIAKVFLYLTTMK